MPKKKDLNCLFYVVEDGPENVPYLAVPREDLPPSLQRRLEKLGFEEQNNVLTREIELSSEDASLPLEDRLKDLIEELNAEAVLPEFRSASHDDFFGYDRENYISRGEYLRLGQSLSSLDQQLEHFLAELEDEGGCSCCDEECDDDCTCHEPDCCCHHRFKEDDSDDLDDSCDSCNESAEAFDDSCDSCNESAEDFDDSCDSCDGSFEEDDEFDDLNDEEPAVLSEYRVLKAHIDLVEAKLLHLLHIVCEESDEIKDPMEDGDDLVSRKEFAEGIQRVQSMTEKFNEMLHSLIAEDEEEEEDDL